MPYVIRSFFQKVKYRIMRFLINGHIYLLDKASIICDILKKIYIEKMFTHAQITCACCKKKKL